ncbi:MAG: hypothetical protein HS104_09710 [Polyangiaceae bacterium]|nr:hypothetical protein [Polyangiaceae bacterium]MCL4754360.1 hypothetical protein [Myxococcales bacterium]
MDVRFGSDRFGHLNRTLLSAWAAIRTGHGRPLGLVVQHFDPPLVGRPPSASGRAAASADDPHWRRTFGNVLVEQGETTPKLPLTDAQRFGHPLLSEPGHAGLGVGGVGVADTQVAQLFGEADGFDRVEYAEQ